jgi:hypothetical protein
MFTYHYKYPYQYIFIVCFFYSLFATVFAQKIAKSEKWLLYSLVVIFLALLFASPVGGMLWHVHDMLAGFFPANAMHKILQGIPEGLGIGWLILLLSFPYNILCTLCGIAGTRVVAKKLLQYPGKR